MKRISGCFDAALDGCFGSADAAMLEAGMSDPSWVNARNWSFIVVTDPEILKKICPLQTANHERHI